jgi:hypothetical protein
MPLPEFNWQGDMPPGLHKATVAEVIARFGTGSTERAVATFALRRVLELAAQTGFLDRFIVFGSYVSAKPSPNDVDIVLVMGRDFKLDSLDSESLAVFDHERAQSELGASVFWTRPGMLFLESMDEFIAGWQRKRDNTDRGIVEVTL